VRKQHSTRSTQHSGKTLFTTEAEKTFPSKQGLNESVWTIHDVLARAYSPTLSYFFRFAFLRGMFFRTQRRNSSRESFSCPAGATIS
jgi:hypothetical protein